MPSSCALSDGLLVCGRISYFDFETGAAHRFSLKNGHGCLLRVIAMPMQIEI